MPRLAKIDSCTLKKILRRLDSHSCFDVTEPPAPTRRTPPTMAKRRIEKGARGKFERPFRVPLFFSRKQTPPRKPSQARHRRQETASLQLRTRTIPRSSTLPSR